MKYPLEFGYIEKHTPTIQKETPGFSIYDMLTAEQRAVVDQVLARLAKMDGEVPQKIVPLDFLANEPAEQIKIIPPMGEKVQPFLGNKQETRIEYLRRAQPEGK